MRRKERSQFPHGHLFFFILLPSSSTIHLEITAGVAMVVHRNILPEHPLCIKEAKVRGDEGLREVHSSVPSLVA